MSFTELTTGVIYNTMKDEHELVKINEKNVTIGQIGKIVSGEINSQEIEFSIPRYYDNVDLLDKKFSILFETKGGIFKVDAVDVAYNDTEIRFNWLLDENATMYAGTIKAVVKIEGTDELGKTYVKKTMNFSVNVEDALNEYGADGVYRTWADGVEVRISELENLASSLTPSFIGTQAEYNTALANGEIKPGTLITITDS